MERRNGLAERLLIFIQYKRTVKAFVSILIIQINQHCFNGVKVHIYVCIYIYIYQIICIYERVL